MLYKHPITIQKLNEQTEKWETHFSCRSEINKVSGNEAFFSDAIQSQSNLTFKVRYCLKIKEIMNNTQLYRIVWQGSIYNIQSYDDFKFRHQEVTLQGSYQNG